MQTDYEKLIRKRALPKIGVGFALLVAVQLLGWVSAAESYFDSRHDAFPLSTFFAVVHLVVFLFFLLPWLCFFIGLLELIMGIPFRAIAWDWDHSKRARSATVAVVAILVLVGLLLLVLQFAFHLNIL